MSEDNKNRSAKQLAVAVPRNIRDNSEKLHPTAKAVRHHTQLGTWIQNAASIRDGSHRHCCCPGCLRVNVEISRTLFAAERHCRRPGTIEGRQPLYNPAQTAVGPTPTHRRLLSSDKCSSAVPKEIRTVGSTSSTYVLDELHPRQHASMLGGPKR